MFLSFFFFVEQGKNNAWPWIGEKPAPLTRLKAGSSQWNRTCLHVSGGPGRSPCLACPHPLAQFPPCPPHPHLPNLTPPPPPPATKGGPREGWRDGCLSPGSEMSLETTLGQDARLLPCCLVPVSISHARKGCEKMDSK